MNNKIVIIIIQTFYIVDFGQYILLNFVCYKIVYYLLSCLFLNLLSVSLTL